MFPINIKTLNEKIVKKSMTFRISLSIITLLVVSTVFYFGLIHIQKEMLKGEMHYGLRRELSYNLFDSTYKGLKIFFNKKGYLLNYSGRNFFDSIKYYLGNLEPYVYRDSLTKPNTVITLKNSINFPDYLSSNNTFLGVGNQHQYLIYRINFNEPDKFILYTVGENGIDEHGDGDDLIFSKDNINE